MGITRRSLLQLMAGASAGAMLTPIPWKLLDDVSIWTQNWFLTAKLPRGETAFRFATCGQCSGGCGIRVRTLGGEPISITGQDAHPGSRGGVCALGMGSPELRFHPLRIAKPVMKNGNGEFTASGSTEVLARIGEALKACKADPASGAIGILDHRPGSALSGVYRTLLEQAGGGHHIVAPSGQTALDGAVNGAFGGPFRAGYDLENTKTLLSFGAPLFEGVSFFGRMAGLGRHWRRMNQADRPGFIHADPNYSVTASMADRWLPIKPGTEGVLALAIGHVLIKENLVDGAESRVADFPAYKALVAGYGWDKAAEITGIDPLTIRKTAREFAKNGPAVALGGGGTGSGPLGEAEEMAVLGLNVLTGNVGVTGGLTPLTPWPPEAARPEVVPAPVPEAPADGEPAEEGEAVPVEPPAPVARPMPSHYMAKSLTDVPDGSIRLLVVDGQSPDAALPWQLVQPKLAKGALTVSLNPFLSGNSLNADIVLPSAVAYEWEFDVPAGPFAARRSYAISPKLCEPPNGLVSPSELVALMAKEAGIEIPGNAVEQKIVATLDAISASKQGNVYDAKSGKTKSVDSFNPKKLRKALTGGGVWIDDSALVPFEVKATLATNLGEIKNGRAETLAGGSEMPLLLMPEGNAGESSGSAMPRMLAKLYRESGLRQLFNTVHINPETGASHRLSDGGFGALKTAQGELKVKVVFDKSVMPGALKVAVAPNPLALGDAERGEYEDALSLVTIGPDGTWRLTRAALKEVRHV